MRAPLVYALASFVCAASACITLLTIRSYNFFKNSLVSLSYCGVCRLQRCAVGEGLRQGNHRAPGFACVEVNSLCTVRVYGQRTASMRPSAVRGMTTLNPLVCLCAFVCMYVGLAGADGVRREPRPVL